MSNVKLVPTAHCIISSSLSTLRKGHFSNMGKVTYGDAIAIWMLIYYTVSLVGSIFVSSHHGFGKNSGWIYLAIFCTIRVINASAQIATITSNSSTAQTVAVITGFIGLSPLLLTTLGLLSRV